MITKYENDVMKLDQEKLATAQQIQALTTSNIDLRSSNEELETALEYYQNKQDADTNYKIQLDQAEDLVEELRAEVRDVKIVESGRDSELEEARLSNVEYLKRIRELYGMINERGIEHEKEKKEMREFIE